jgi:hypothetical protein
MLTDVPRMGRYIEILPLLVSLLFGKSASFAYFLLPYT